MILPYYYNLVSIFFLISIKIYGYKTMKNLAGFFPDAQKSATIASQHKPSVAIDFILFEATSPLSNYILISSYTLFK